MIKFNEVSTKPGFFYQHKSKNMCDLTPLREKITCNPANSSFRIIKLADGCIYDNDLLIGKDVEFIGDHRISYTQVSSNQYMNGLKREMEFIGYTGKELIKIKKL